MIISVLVLAVLKYIIHATVSFLNMKLFSTKFTKKTKDANNVRVRRGFCGFLLQFT